MKLSFKQRIMASVLAAALIPMFTIGAINGYLGYRNASQLSEAGIKSMEDATTLRAKDYFAALMLQVKQRANDNEMQQALQELIRAENSFDLTSVAVNESALKARYTYQEENTKGAQKGDGDKWVPTDRLMMALQHLYISGNPHKIGEKQKLLAANDGSLYSQIHAKYHPVLRDFVENFGFYDVFMVDAETGRVVYTNFKEIDFMSNVKAGVLFDTGFSRVVRQALASTDSHAVFMSDIEPYMPSYNDGAIFMASPMVIDGKTKGVFAVQLPTDKLFGMFKSLKELGKTVDGFIVGQDMLLRTPQIAETGKVGDKVNASLAKQVAQVFDGKKASSYKYENSSGQHMTAAMRLLDYPGVNWVMMVTQADSEMLASTYQQLWMVTGITLAAIVLLSFFGWWLANQLSAPVARLGRDFNTSSERVGRSTGMVGDAVASMIAASEETSAQSTVVRKNSSEAAGYVGSVHSAVEELNTSIHDISRSIHETNVLVDDAVGKAQHTNEVVRKLGEAGQRISEVVGLINDLAAQTNLLALNAAIEAARAGDAGRGFAVVADEVKKLASHTTQATVDIGAQIHEIQEATEQSVVALQTVVDAIHRIRDNATAVSAAVEEQSGVAKQISGSVQDAANRVQQVDENMNGIEQAANDTGVAADQVNIAVGEVQTAFGDMKTQLGKALADMGVKS